MPAETPNDQAETLSDSDIAKRLDHIDAMLHGVDQKLAAMTAHLDNAMAFIDAHKAALTRGLGMLDASGRMSKWMGGKHGKQADG